VLSSERAQSFRSVLTPTLDGGVRRGAPDPVGLRRHGLAAEWVHAPARVPRRKTGMLRCDR